MISIKCDRCSKYFEFGNDIPNRLVLASQMIHGTPRQYYESAAYIFDLCPSCMRAIMKFINIRRDNDNKE